MVKSKICYSVIFAIVLLFSQAQNPNRGYLATQNIPDPQLSEEQGLPDKIYTFLAPVDNLTFESFYLESYYMYYLTIEVVTPHACRAKVNIFDPAGVLYKIFEANLTQGEYSNYHTIPFGAAISGGYRLEISTESALNFNLHVKLEQGLKCLYDKLSSEETENLAYYKVNNFYNGKHVEHDMELKSDWMYKMCLARVNAISTEESDDVYIDLAIVSPDHFEFLIYSRTTLANLDSMTTFLFGTAISGVYTLKLTVHCNVSNINLAYAVIDEYSVLQEIDTNETNQQEVENNDPTDLESNLGNKTSLPMDYFLLSVVFIYAIVVGTIILAYNEKKNRKKRIMEELHLANQQKRNKRKQLIKELKQLIKELKILCHRILPKSKKKEQKYL